MIRLAEKKLELSSNGKIEAYGAMFNAAKISNYFQYVKMIKEIEQKAGFELAYSKGKKLDASFMSNLKKLNASQEISRSKYDGDYPRMIEFEKPWTCCTQASQSPPANAAISYDRTPLQSESFTQCIAMLMKNEKNSQTALYHIWDIDLEGKHLEVLKSIMLNFVLDATNGKGESYRAGILEMLSEVCKYSYSRSMTRAEFQSLMEEINREGIIKARFIYGKVGRQSTAYRVGDSMLNYLGVKVDSDIYVDSERWSIVYKPSESMIYIDSRVQKELIQYQY